MEKTKEVKKVENIEPYIGPIGVHTTPVNQYNLNGAFIQQYPSISKAAEETKTNPSSLSLCLKGKFKQSGGFQWRKA